MDKLQSRDGATQEEQEKR